MRMPGLEDIIDAAIEAGTPVNEAAGGMLPSAQGEDGSRCPDSEI